MLSCLVRSGQRERVAGDAIVTATVGRRRRLALTRQTPQRYSVFHLPPGFRHVQELGPSAKAAILRKPRRAKKGRLRESKHCPSGPAAEREPPIGGANRREKRRVAYLRRRSRVHPLRTARSDQRKQL